MANTKNRREYRIPCEDWEATQVERSVHIIDRATGKTIKVIPVPKAWGDEWGWNFIEGGIAIERSPQHEAPPAGRSRAVAIAALARQQPAVERLAKYPAGLSLHENPAHRWRG